MHLKSEPQLPGGSKIMVEGSLAFCLLAHTLAGNFIPSQTLEPTLEFQLGEKSS